MVLITPRTAIVAETGHKSIRKEKMAMKKLAAMFLCLLLVAMLASGVVFAAASDCDDEVDIGLANTLHDILPPELGEG